MKISLAVYVLSMTTLKICLSKMSFLSCNPDMVYLILSYFFLKEFIMYKSIPASLQLNEVQRKERGETQFLCRKKQFSRLSARRFGSRSDHVYLNGFRAILHLPFGCCPDMLQPNPPAPICICFLLQEKMTVCIRFYLCL